jgi:uncharacterized membrane protein required for colicin V production
MMQYWFLILCGIIYFFNLTRGIKRGFVGMLYRFLTTAVAIIASAFASGPIGQQLKVSTQLYTIIEEKCAVAVTNTVQTGTIADSLLGASGVLDGFAQQLADLIFTIVVFILAFILIKLALWLFLIILESLADLPVLRTVNRFGGAFVGILNATMIVWLLMFVVSTLKDTSYAQMAIANIKQFSFLTFLYTNNPIQHIVNAIL